MSRLANHLFGGAKAGAPPLRGRVALTFDDGWETVHTVIMPVLKKYDYRGTVYVTTDMVGKEGYLTLGQLRQLQDLGWCIGSHTQTHPHLQ